MSRVRPYNSVSTQRHEQVNARAFPRGTSDGPDNRNNDTRTTVLSPEHHEKMEKTTGPIIIISLALGIRCQSWWAVGTWERHCFSPLALS